MCWITPHPNRHIIDLFMWMGVQHTGGHMWFCGSIHTFSVNCHHLRATTLTRSTVRQVCTVHPTPQPRIHFDLPPAAGYIAMVIRHASTPAWRAIVLLSCTCHALGTGSHPCWCAGGCWVTWHLRQRWWTSGGRWAPPLSRPSPGQCRTPPHKTLFSPPPEKTNKTVPRWFEPNPEPPWRRQHWYRTSKIHKYIQ